MTALILDLHAGSEEIDSVDQVSGQSVQNCKETGSFPGLGDRVTRQRVMIGLDGLESGFAERLMAAGDMPGLGTLRRQSLRFTLDHCSAQHTGLAWEHAASGLSPEAGRRWGAVEFDPSSYTAWQEGARSRNGGLASAGTWSCSTHRMSIFAGPGPLAASSDGAPTIPAFTTRPRPPTSEWSSSSDAVALWNAVALTGQE